MFYRKAVFVLVLALSLCAVNASAGLLYTNLGPSNEYDTGSGYFVDGSNYFNQVMAAPFAPSSSSTGFIATLALGNYAGSNSPIDLYLEADSGGLPSGILLATMTQNGTIPAYNSGGGLVSFDCTFAGCGLTAGTTYWLVARESDPASEQAWMWDYLDALGNGAFNQLGSATGPWNSYSSIVVGFRVDSATSAVPEPGSMLLLGTGLIGIAGVIRRRRK